MLDRHRPHLLGDQPGQTFMQAHAQNPDTLAAEPFSGSQNQVGPVRLEQVDGTDVGFKSLGDEGDHVGEGGGLAALGRQIGNLFQGENVVGVSFAGGGIHIRSIGASLDSLQSTGAIALH